MVFSGDLSPKDGVVFPPALQTGPDYVSETSGDTIGDTDLPQPGTSPILYYVAQLRCS